MEKEERRRGGRLPEWRQWPVRRLERKSRNTSTRKELVATHALSTGMEPTKNRCL
jgi:hypothetical protein